MESTEKEEEILEFPDNYKCPITQEIMTNPVIASDGHSYEKDAIKKWFDSGKRISPMTGLRLDDIRLIDNITLKKVISDFKEKCELHRLDSELEKKKSELALVLKKGIEKNAEMKFTRNSFWYEEIINKVEKFRKEMKNMKKLAENQLSKTVFSENENMLPNITKLSLGKGNKFVLNKELESEGYLGLPKIKEANIFLNLSKDTCFNGCCKFAVAGLFF